MSFDSFIPRIFKQFNKTFIAPYKGSRSQFIFPTEKLYTAENPNAFKTTDKPEVLTPKTSNQKFKDQLNLNRVCKKCLENNGYDIDCIRNINPIGLDCNGKNINFCESCQEECAEFCDPNFGNTDNQFKLVTEVLSTPFYSDNLGNAVGSTFQNPNYWKGYITQPQADALNVLFKGLTGAATSNKEINELAKGLNPDIAVNYKSSVGDYVNNYSNQNTSVGLLTTPTTGPGTNGGGGGGGAGGGDPDIQCEMCLFNGGSPGALPLYLVYRYSKCALVWFPPEYIFNYNPNVTQGQGWKRTGLQEVYRTCDLVIADSRDQFSNGGINNSDLDASCIKSYYNGLCSQGLNCICRERGNFPCQCFSYPHLSGGLVDTVKKQFNVSQREFMGGYFPASDPFLPRMTTTEANCMTCYRSYTSLTGNDCDPAFEVKRLNAAAWPKASGLGKTPQTIGPYCNTTVSSSPNPDLPFYNPNYTFSCFSRGVSPYLNRIATRTALAAHDIINYGSADPAEYETLGPTYKSTIIQTGKNKAGNTEWTSVKFKKAYNKKDLLYNKLVGLVGIDHHFECWAYHSKNLFCPPPISTFNHARLLILPYERPYGGIVTPTKFTYDPREAQRFQHMKSFPRSVIYGSSTVPIFYADIYAMEVLSQKYDIKVDGEYFDGERFLEQFYKYFYNMTVRNGETAYNEPLIFESDISDYTFVSNWLKQMIKNNILSVKDHAPDIADELVDILDNTSVETLPSGDIDVTFRDAMDDISIGGKSGYITLIDFLYTLTGACGPERTWSNIKPYFSSKNIKQLIRPQSHQRAPGQMFWAPRRVKLYPTPDKAGLTAWGCENSGCSDYGYSPNLIPPDEYPLEFFSLDGGDRTWFATTNSGKLQAFGHDTNIFCGVDSQSVIDGIGKLGCYPAHLSYADELQALQNSSNLSDGQVIKVSSKGSNAVALVDYSKGFVVGPAEGDAAGTAAQRRLCSNSGYVLGNGDLKYQTFYGKLDTDSGFGTPLTLRSWGSETHGIFYQSPTVISDYFIPSWIPFIGTVGYVGTLQNNYFAYKDVACGVKHTAAITFDGALFMTPDSQSLDGNNLQTSYGYPTVSSRKASTSQTQEKLLIGRNALVMYKQFPKPGYFTDEEWERLYDGQRLNDTTGSTYINQFKCNRTTNTRSPCDIRCYLYQIGVDSLIDNENDTQGYLFEGGPGSSIRVDTPVYTNVAAGHYHTLALSDDNNIKIWGQYVKIKPDGSVLGVSETDVSGNTGVQKLDVFLPSNEIYPDEWTLGGLTYGCRDTNVSDSNADHVPYLVYTEANKTVYASKKIFAIEGGPDYSILARKEGNMDRLVIWGHAEMVESVSGIPINGLTGSYGRNFHKIEKIVAGPNAVSVLYKKENAYSPSTEIFVRKGRKTKNYYNFGLTGGLEGKYYSDITSTYGNAAGIYTAGLVAHTWDGDSFSPGHAIWQFNNYNALPQYFRSQAFFRAVPGRWEITKWLFGRPCHLLGTDFIDNQVAKPDKCSVYYKKGDINRSYTGIPEYYWMRGTWKRKQQATPLHSYDPTKGGGCGIIRNLENQDGMNDNTEYGTGAIPGNLQDVNIALNRSFGGCYGNGDICWIGDGSPSPYAYQSNNFTSNAVTCQCLDDVCGCPPYTRQQYKLNCDANATYIGTRCFDYVTGRVGFNSNKDYFIQSAKAFGKLNGKGNFQLNVGECCGVVQTNITGFLYAKRDYYYAYNSTTQNYNVKDAPLQYRPVFVGYDRPVEGEVYGLTSSRLFNEIMVPKDALINAYTVENVMKYPKVYVGGPNLQPLEKDYNESKQRNLACPSANLCAGEPCDDPCAQQSGCMTKSPYDLVGPGGWVHAYGQKQNCDFADPVIQGGFFNETATANYYEKDMYLSIVATDDWLKGMVSVGDYTGRLPPGLSAAECWCGPTSAANPTGVGNCPNGGFGCPNGERVCENCRWCCALPFGLFYEIRGTTGIDNPGLFYPGNAPLPSPSEDGILEIPPYLWYRVYEEIPSTYNVACPGLTYGFTGAPIAFQGFSDETDTSVGDFKARCFDDPNDTVPMQIIGETSDVRCDLYFNS